MFYSRSPHTAATAHPLPFDSFLYLLRLAVQLIFAGGLFITASGSTDIRAQTTAAPATEQVQAATMRRYNIPAGPLSAALTQFSTEAGIFLVGANDLAQGKNSPGVQGSFSIQGALDILLTGTGLEAKRNAQGQYVLQPVTNTVGTLPLMTVSTSADSLKQGTAEEGYRVSNISGVGLWDERSLRDTPYSISVVTSDLIENVNAQNMGQIFKMNPLIQEPSTNVTTGVPNATMRGFNATTPIYDGIPLAYSNGSAISVIEIDRVEILSGTSGFLYGGGRVGGAINYVTKSPTSVPLRRLTFGNYGGTQFYGHTDIGGKFDDHGRFGYRVNLLYQGGDTAIGEPVEQKIANVALDWRITDTLYADVKYTYNDHIKKASQPLFFMTERTTIDTSKRYSPKWNANEVESHKVYTSLRWDPSKYFTLRSAFFYQDTGLDSHQITLMDQGNKTFSQGLLNLSKEKHNNYGGYIYSDTRFSISNIDHKLTLGYSSNYYEQLVRNDGWAYLNGTSTLALSQLKYIPEPDWGPMGNKSMNPSYADQYNNILMGDNIIINDQWSVMFGLNYSTAINKA